MTFPLVVAVAPGSPADQAGVAAGDEIRSMNGSVPSDVIAFQLLADEAFLSLEIGRGGIDLEVAVEKRTGEPLGVEVSSPLFDRVRTCDNHCAFCFIYQLPKGMRKSLYVKDDDFRLSFLYGNFTTLTRFTELDFERIVEERLSPLYVSIHSTDPDLRAEMLRNRRGATSLRWLRLLLEHGIEVHGQVVVCPGVNDSEALEDTMAGVLERYSGLSSIGVVPLGVSRYTREESMRPHTPDEVGAVLEIVDEWQARFSALLGRRLVYAADEYYLLAGRPLPDKDEYEDFPQVENGIGMARSFVAAFEEGVERRSGRHGGFFASVDGAPAYGYRANRSSDEAVAGRSPESSTTILTGTYGAAVLGPLLSRTGFSDVEVRPVVNEFFGGNIGVTGLLTFADVDAALREVPDDRRVLLPDVCLSGGRFLDGGEPAALFRGVEVVASDGAALRRALSRRQVPVAAGFG